MLAIIDAYRAGLLHINHWWSNLLAGLIVGIVAVPLAMAFAIASGVKPEQGLYTAIIAGLIVAIFGGSRTQIAGPTGAFIVILANITAHYGIDGLQIATLLAGFILLFLGLIRIGNVIKFIPDPVIVGFTGGIGFIIFVGEWKDFFGLTIHLPLDAPFYQKFLLLLHGLSNINWPTTMLASLSLISILITPKFFKRIPGPLVAMLVATSLQAIFHFQGIATIGSAFGGIPQHPPLFHLPSITFAHSLELIGPAFTIALLGAIESLLSATAADNMAGTRHHANQELIGQGLANIAAPLFGGFAATGAIARTATNIRNGGNSPLAAIAHSLTIILTIMVLAPFAAAIPLCSLAAILFVIACNMSDIPHFIRMLKTAPRYDLIVLFATFLLTIFTNLVVAVNVGVILAMLFFVRGMSKLVKVEEQPHYLDKNTIVYAIQGPFFFGVTEKIEHSLTKKHANASTIIFQLKEVPFMDITGLETFCGLITQYHHRQIKVYICEANIILQKKLSSMGILATVEGKKIFNSLSEILQIISNLNSNPAILKPQEAI